MTAGILPRYFIISAVMGLPAELYTAMLEVSYAAARNPQLSAMRASLMRTAREGLPLWRENERAMAIFARVALGTPGCAAQEGDSLRELVVGLPEPVALPFWRLIVLLEYIAYDGANLL